MPTHYITSRISGNPNDDSFNPINSGAVGAVSVFDPMGCAAAAHKQINWANWIYSPQTTNDNDGAYIDGDGDMHPSDHPTHGERPVAVIDVFAGLSQKLGKQMSQEKIAYIESVTLRLRNSGTTSNDNEESVGFQGTLAWYAPKRDRVRAYKMYRAAWRVLQRDDTSNHPFFPTEKQYRSLRVGIVRYNSSRDTVPYQSNTLLSDVGGATTVDGICLVDIFHAYDKMNGVMNAAGQVAMENKPDTLQWLSGRCLALPETVHWSVGCSNPKSGGPGAGYQDWTFYSPQISVMNGLLVLTLDGSSTTNAWTGATWSDEEYGLEIGVGVKGWKGLA